MSTPPWTYVDDGARLVPIDPHAEQSLAGAAIAKAETAHAIKALVAGRMYDRQLWAVIEAAAALPDDVNDVGLNWLDPDTNVALACHGCARRGRAVAEVVGIEEARVTQLVANRSTASFDYLVDRVVTVRDARQANRDHIDALAANGVDVDAMLRAEVKAGELVDQLADVASLFELAVKVIGQWMRGEVTERMGIDALVHLGEAIGVEQDTVADVLKGDDHG